MVQRGPLTVYTSVQLPGRGPGPGAVTFTGSGLSPKPASASERDGPTVP